MNIYIKSEIWKDIEEVRPVNQFSIHHNIEMNCEDSSFFCANHVIDLVNSISVMLSSEERDIFYTTIKENLGYAVYRR